MQKTLIYLNVTVKKEIETLRSVFRIVSLCNVNLQGEKKKQNIGWRGPSLTKRKEQSKVIKRDSHLCFKIDALCKAHNQSSIENSYFNIFYMMTYKR